MEANRGRGGGVGGGADCGPWEMIWEHEKAYAEEDRIMEPPSSPNRAHIFRDHTPESHGSFCPTVTSTQARKETKLQHSGQHAS